MSTSTWGELEPFADDIYPPTLLKYFLKQVITQSGAHGACMAVYHESANQMIVQAHIRLQHLPSLNNLPNFPSSSQANQLPLEPNDCPQKKCHMTINLFQDRQSPYATPSSAFNSATRSPNTISFEDVTPEQSGLFAVGTHYPLGHDLIGCSWQKNETLHVRHEDYAAFFPSLHPFPFHVDIIPISYLVIPIQETTLIEEMRKQKVSKHVMGVLVLYQVTHTAINMNILSRNIISIHSYVERIALYLQNDRLQRAKRQTSEYLQLLQNISTVFPSSVKLSDLVEHVYSFVSKVVDISSMLLTLYDRDLKRLYDVFALRNGQRIEGLVEQPVVRLPEDRPVWWHMTQNERRTLQFSPREDQQQAKTYAELLTGIWGDQRGTGSFLLLPMKMFTRVIGALCLTSERTRAYRPEEIQVLETMVQIVTVSVENAKLYERDRDVLYRATQREQQLALVNSALQAISSSLNVTELLNNLVEAVAHILRVNMCVFFELTSDNHQFFAHALYAPHNIHMYDDGSGMPIIPPQKKKEPDELITTIRLPFKDTILEQRITEGFFYMEPAQLEELALKCGEEGAIFLREIGIHYILLIPMHTQNKILGFLAVPVPTGMSVFRPKDVGTLLTICAQTASAIRNAQIFEEREEAYAEMKRMSEIKDEFLVTAAHELRTPLTAISGYSSQLKRQSARANPQQILRFATKIGVASQQLIAIIANMTEAAQIGAADKQLDLHVEPVQLLAAIEAAINMLAFKSEQHILADVTPNLWVTGDAPRVRQVLTNLLENAAKYSLPDSTVHVSATKLVLSQVEPLLSPDQIDHEYLMEHSNQQVVLVRVKDRGEGIEPEEQQRIFEKFVRATRILTTPIRGAGLGLYICRRFVNAMGGRLWLEKSIPNEGSTFSFYLPSIEPPITNMQVE